MTSKRWAVLLAAVAVVALAGVASASTRWLITSSRQIKPSVLKTLTGKVGPRGLQGSAGTGG